MTRKAARELREARRAARLAAERAAIVEALDLDDAQALVSVGVRAARGLAGGRIADLLRQLAHIAAPAFARPDDERVESVSLWRQGADFHLLFQPRFIRGHVHTGRCLTFVVLHEILHRTFGHLARARPGGLGGRADADLRGISADLQVNAWLLRNVFPRSPPILDRLYDDTKLPTALLRSPESLGQGSPFAAEDIGLDWFDGSEAWRKFLPDPRAHAAGEIWQDAYRDEPPSFDALLARMADLFPEMTAPSEVFLLGTHGADAEGSGPGEPDIWTAWLRSELSALGAGDGTALQQQDVAVVDSKCREIWEAVRRAVAPDNRPTSLHAVVPDRGVVPAAGRREALLLGFGVVPVLWPTPQNSRATIEERANVYVDVSGSMDAVLPFVLGMVRQLGEHAGRVFQFSNVVEPLDVEALRAGRIRTTGGTDFDCVARHILERRIRKAVVVTDGAASLAAPLERELARRTKLFVVLTEDAASCPLLALAGRSGRGRTWWVLPPGIVRSRLFVRERPSVESRRCRAEDREWVRNVHRSP